MQKRGSIYLTVFIIAAAIAVFFLMNAQPEAEGGERLEITEQYAEMSSTFLYQAIENSEARATREFGTQALQGINKGYWTSYSLPSPPEFEDVKDTVELRVKELVNDYLQQIDGQVVSGVTIDSSTAIIEDVVVDIPKEDDLMDKDDDGIGDHDESFSVTVKAKGAIEFEQEGKPQKTFQETSFQVPINNWRFWYLYRTIKKWSMDNSFSEAVCDEMPQYGIAGDQACHYKAVDPDNTGLPRLDDAVQRLEEMFDDQVDCSYELLCGDDSKEIRTEVWPIEEGDCSGAGACGGYCAHGGCDYQNNVEDCEIKCSEKDACADALPPDQRPICQEGNVTYSLGPYGPPYPSFPTDPKISKECWGMGSEHFWSQIAEITCVDNKYLRPLGEQQPEPLEFKFKVHLHFYRFHKAYDNQCVSVPCVTGGSESGGGTNENDPGGNEGGSSTPPGGGPGG